MEQTVVGDTGLVIRPFTAEDVHGVWQLGLRCFDPRERISIAKEVWRYVNTPAGVIPGSVAVDGDRIVASYTAWPVTLCMGEDRVKGAQVVVVMTDPDYRNQGLSVKLGLDCLERMKREGYEVVYCFPNDVGYPGHMRRVQWAHIGDVRILKRLIPPVPGWLDPMPFTIRAKPIASTQRHYLIADDNMVQPDTLVSIAARRHLRGIHLQRDAAWFNWRYWPGGLHVYQTLIVRTSDQPVAAITYHTDGDRLVIAETLGDTDALLAGVNALIEQARSRDIRVMTALTTDQDVINVLRCCGFWFRGHEHFIVKLLSDRIQQYNPYALENWKLFGGDHDFY